jgi:hypothetical protein
MNYLIVLFGAALFVTIGLLLLFGFSGTPLAQTDAPTTGPVSTRTQLPSGPTRTVSTAPSPVKPFFRSMKTVYSARAFRFNGTNITLGDYESDMNKWRVEFPLNFTHVRFTGQTVTYNNKVMERIFKFNRPNTSDSSGYMVDDMDQQMNPQPASFFGNTIEFGMFF